MRLWPVGALGVVAVLGFFALRHALSALERSGRIPGEDASRRSLFTDLGYIVLSPATEVVSRVVTTLILAGCAVLAGRHVGPEILRGFGPVMRQPRWLIISEMFVLSDFIYYWTHRMAHTVPALWRLHAVHHSTRHLRWTSALRAHPGEVYAHVIPLVPLFLLGFPVEGLLALAPVISLYALFIHVDVNLSAGRLGYVLNSPRFHGWHHALEVDGPGVNFAGFFPLFDALFGTYRLPGERPRDVGIEDPEMPDTCLAQLGYPFRDRAATPPEGGPSGALAESIPPVSSTRRRDRVPSSSFSSSATRRAARSA